MTRPADIVKEAVSEISAAVKEIKQSDEDDLAKLAARFDEVSEKAERVAGRLFQADEALAGSGDDEKEDGGEEEGGDAGS